MFIRSWFSGCFVNRKVIAFLLISFPDCFLLFSCQGACASGKLRFLITRSGYHGLFGLSFNPWFDFSFRRKGCLSVSAGGKHGRKCVPEALRNHRAHCLFASCAAAVGRSHSMTAPESSQTIFPLVSRFPWSARRPWRASIDMQLRQTDAMINHLNCNSAKIVVRC